MDSHDQARSQTTESPRTISRLSALCQNAFEDLCLLLPRSAHHGLANAIQDEAGRFQVWAGNIGAFQNPQSSSSLDSRLRHSELLRTSVESGLQRLESAIRRAVLIVSGKKQNRTEGAEHSANDATSHKAQRGLTGPGKKNSAETPTTELSKLFLNAQSCITNLFTLSMLIRRDRPRGRIRHDSLNSERGDAGPDITNVQDKFPKLKQSIWLAQRIGSSIMRQREYIRYRQSHRKILTQSHGAIGPDGESILYPGQATTKATSFYESSTAVDGRISDSMEDLSGQSIRSSATSFATTAAGTGSGRRIPELTDMWLHGVQLNYNTHIECPYCRTIQMFGDRHQWKRHVYSDLRLYICTFEGCSVEPFPSSHEWFEHEIGTHRRQWKCYLCNVICQSPRSLEGHFVSKHASNVPAVQREVMIRPGEQAVTRFDEGACLLCNDWKPHQADAHNKNRFQSHLEKHLQELARDAIPLAIEGLEVKDEQGDEEIEPGEHQEGDQASLPPKSDPDSISLSVETASFVLEHEETKAAEERFGTETQTPDQHYGYHDDTRNLEELLQLQQSDMALPEVLAPTEYPEQSTVPASKQSLAPPSPGPNVATKVQATETQQFRTQLREIVERMVGMPLTDLGKVEEDSQKESQSVRDEIEARAQDDFLAIIQGRGKGKDDDDQRTKLKNGILFKDAIGRKFAFPFYLCATWQGMEELIKQAFLHTDVLGPHVQEGHYDLIGPGGEIILPSAWEEVVEPGWSVTMTMWPMDKSPPLTNRLPPGGKIPIPPLPNRRAGVPTSGRQPEGAVPVGEMPPPPLWPPDVGTPAGPAHGIDIVTAAPPEAHKKEKRGSAPVLTFLAGKPATKKTAYKATDTPPVHYSDRTESPSYDAGSLPEEMDHSS